MPGFRSLPDTHTASARMGRSQQKQPNDSWRDEWCELCHEIFMHLANMVNVVCKCLLLNLDQFNLTSIFEFSPPKQLILYGLNPGICWFSQQNRGVLVGCVSPQIKPRGINGINPTPGHSDEALPKVFARFLHIGDHEEQGVSKVSNDRLVQVLG